MLAKLMALNNIIYYLKLHVRPLVIESLKTFYIQLPSSLHRPFVFMEDNMIFKDQLTQYKTMISFW